jgi:RNA polymerase sigma-70 factor (ECF subfamily)
MTFSDLYDEHVWHVYGFFAYRVGNRADVEELTQHTFERALRAWPRFDPHRASPLTWLIAIARNALIDFYRRRHVRREETLDADASDWMPSVAGPESDLGLEPELEAALGTLGAREREVLALRFGADLTGPQIAESTGLTLANVQQSLSRALRKLRERLVERQDGAGKAQLSGGTPEPTSFTTVGHRLSRERAGTGESEGGNG